MASARPSAVLRLSAKIETSVVNVIRRNTDIDPTTASAPRVIGRAAASRPPNTHTSTRKLSGMAMTSISSRSSWFCLFICAYSIAGPPARTVTPSRSWTNWSERVWAFFCALSSPPFRLTTIKPDFPSALTRFLAACGDAVQADDTV